MKKKFVLSVIASVCCVLTAAADFSGYWEGTWNSTAYFNSGSMATDIIQEGNSLSGWLDFETAYDGPFGMPITGTVAGNIADITGSIIVQGYTYVIRYTQAQLSADGTRVTGNYSVTENGAWWDSGTFEMIRPGMGGNDNFANATLLTGASGEVSGSNVGATIEMDEPYHAGEGGGASVWWTWTAPYNCNVWIDTLGSEFNTLLAVYTGSTIGGLMEVASNDDSDYSEYGESELSFTATANTTYRIAVDGYSEEDQGTIVLTWQAIETIGTWSPMNTTGAPNLQMQQEMYGEKRTEVWTGSRWLVYGQSMSTMEPAGALYNPSADAWTAMNMTGAPDIDLWSYKSVWTGSKWLVFGIGGLAGPAGLAAGPDGPAGALYDPSANAWTAMNMAGAPDVDLMNCKTVWTGSRWLVYGQSMLTMGPAGALYNPSANAWTTMSMAGAPDISQMDMMSDWTGSRWLVYGYSMSAMGPAGALYDPSANAWTAMNMSGAPNLDTMGRKTVWNGARWLVYGQNISTMEPAGALYDPSANAWSAMSMTGTPDINFSSALTKWTGIKWLVLGMNLNDYYPEGALYDPVANTWQTMSIEGMPDVEFWSAKEIWTGARWLVYGYDYYGEMSTGAIYDPVSNTWKGMNQANNPHPYWSSDRTLWTGRELLAWGSSWEEPNVSIGGRFALPNQIAQYTLNVVGGSGSGLYASGSHPPIAAQIPAGQSFDRWTGAVQYLANAASASTTVTMPAATITVTATFKKTGLAHLGDFFEAGNPADIQSAATRFQEAVTANSLDYPAKVYSAFTKIFNLINDAPLNALMAQFGFTYEDLGGENGWNITGDFNFTGAPPSNQAIDTLWTRCQPVIDEAYTLLNAIPASWVGTAEVSTEYFPVDETVYVDYPDVVSAKAMLKAMRSFLNTLRAYDMTVNYAAVDWPYSLPSKTITVDGDPSDWASLPVQLVGAAGDALRSVKGCRSGNTVYLLIEKEVLQLQQGWHPEYFDGTIKVKLGGERCDFDFRAEGDNVQAAAWFYVGGMFQELPGNVVLSNDYVELSFVIPPEVGTLTDAGCIDWVSWRQGSWGWYLDECELDFPDNHPANNLLTLFPDVLKSVRNPTALTLAKTDLANAVDLGQDAGTRIKNRTGGEMHFFEYDPLYAADYDEFMDRLANVKTSLTTPTVFNVTPDDDVTAHLSAFYTAPYVTREMLPSYRTGAHIFDPITGTFPDPTFGGVFPNLTRSDFAEWLTEDKNLVLHSNGGVLESFTSQFNASTYAAARLTDGAVGTGTHNWLSAVNPGPQTFEYSFSEGQSANLTSLTLVNATRTYNVKDFQLWISADGSSAWAKIAEGTLADNAKLQNLDLEGQSAQRVKLVITSGYRTDYWELAEFELYGNMGKESDLFSKAIMLSGLRGQVSGASNVDATKEAGEPDHAGMLGGASVWWKWTAPANADVVISTFGSDFDTLLAVYTGSALENLIETASNNNADFSVQSMVSFAAVANTTYWIAVDGDMGTRGSITLNWTAKERLGIWTPMSGSGFPNIMKLGDPSVLMRKSDQVWTGTKWLMLGLSRADAVTPAGALYNPSTDTWSVMNMAGAPDISQMDMRSVWTGSRWLVYGNSMSATGPAGALYNPSANTWSAMSMEGAPDITPMSCKTVWTGTRWLVYRQSMTPMEPPAGALYDPSANTWSAMNMVGAPNLATMNMMSAWTGTRWLVYGQIMFPMGTAGALYDPSANTWSAMSMAGGPAMGPIDYKSVWTGTRLLVYGPGMSPMGPPGGKLYDPSANTWTAMSTTGAPNISLMDMMSVWTGTHWLVYGNNMSMPPTMGLAGARYNPAANSWSAMDMTDAPDIDRMSAESLWTGSKWLVAGPSNMDAAAWTGALYDPVEGIWAPMNLVGSPDISFSTTRTLWTGAEWLVCGESREDPAIGIGGRYALQDQIAQYTLNVVGGSGSGLYASNSLVTITAQVPAGKTFDRWSGAVQYLANASSSSTTVTMPAATITVTATFKKTGLGYLGDFFEQRDPQDMQGAATFYQNAVTANPQDYQAKVYAAFTKMFNLINDSELNALMAQFGFTYEDLGGEDGWNITGDFNFDGAPPSNQAIDTLWTRCQPVIDEAYTLLNAIPASWVGTAEVSTEYFPVDETVYVDYPDVVSAKAMLKAMRSFLNTLRAYDMTVNYATADWPYSLPSKTITVDGDPSDWASLPVQLVGAAGDALRSVKGCRSGNTVYLLIEKAALLQQVYSEGFWGTVRIELDGERGELDIEVWAEGDNAQTFARLQVGEVFQELQGNVAPSTEYVELSFVIPPEVGTLTNAGCIDWVEYRWWGENYGHWHSGYLELNFPENYPANNLLTLFPDVLKSVRNPTALTLAKTDLASAVDLGQDAGTRIKNRTGGEMHFFEYDPQYAADYDEFMDTLANVKTSLTTPTVFSITPDDEVTVHLGAFYTSPYVTREMLPAYRIGAHIFDPISGTFPDPTFGGVTPNLTRSDLAGWLTGDKNLVLHSNGGVLESFTSQYNATTYAAARLTDGAVGTGTHNWLSAANPGPQTFEYSFSEGQSARVTSLSLVNTTSANKSKNFELWASADGGAWERIKEGTLADNAELQSIDLEGQIAQRVRLVITSGYNSAYWELAEFELYGSFVEPLPSYTVTFDAQGGITPTPASKNVFSNMTYGVLATTTRPGYTFAGWWTEADGTGTQVTPATVVTITSAQTLYAHWMVNAISTVTFDAQGGDTPIPMSTTVTNGLTYGTLATTTRAGYTFAGWWTAANGTGAQVTAATTVTITAAQTLYANWVEIAVLTVTFDAQGGTAPAP
ncbi:MAG: InlB B-repeat-containing protein, partial [Kiritimatiellia bacterium]